MKMPHASSETAALLDALLEGDPRVKVRKMFGHPAGFANGNMCVGTFGGELFVRLGDSEGRLLSQTPGVRRFEPMPGRPMKQYFVLPPAILQKPAQAKKWVARSIEYVLSLPPK